MDRELLIKFFAVSDYITAEIKSHRIKSTENEHHCKDKGCKDECYHNHNKKEGHNHDRKEKLSLTSKNTLRILLDLENVNQRTLAKHLNVAAQTMSDTIKKLEERGFVAKINNKINNENIIVLTENGKEKAIELNKIIDSATKNILSNLTEEEKETFLALLSKIYREGE